jgi:hypothetical protein
MRDGGQIVSYAARFQEIRTAEDVGQTGRAAKQDSILMFPNAGAQSDAGWPMWIMQAPNSIPCVLIGRAS